MQWIRNAQEFVRRYVPSIVVCTAIAYYACLALGVSPNADLATIGKMTLAVALGCELAGGLYERITG